MRLTLDKALLLKSVELFSSVPALELLSLASIISELSVAPGEDILREGEVGSTMYVIVSGRVRVHLGGRTIAELGEREVVGELAALDPAPRSATVTAVEETELLEIGAEPLLDILQDHPDVTRAIFRVLCARLRNVLVQ